MLPGAPVAIDRAIDTAIRLRDAGQGGAALNELKAALATWPGEAGLWQTLGTVHRALEQSSEAIDAFSEAVRLRPQNVRAAQGVAQATLEAGRPAAALFEALARKAPGEGQLLLGLAAAQWAEGDAEAALKGLATAVDANPLWLEGQATLADLRWQAGDRQGFAGGYVSALRAHPAHLGLWLALIDLLVRLEMYDTATNVIAQAHQSTGEIAPLMLAEAICASELGDIAAADAAFDRIVSPTAGVAVIERHTRHLIATRRVEQAADGIDAALSRADADSLWPYAALIWRVLDDPRWQWLEGDPALVATYDLDIDLPALAERLRALHTARSDPLGQSVRGGTQTDGPLFANAAPEIQSARTAIVDAVGRHIAGLGRRDPRHPTLRHVGKPFRFAGSWSVRLTDGGHHSPHVHSRGWLSSACHIVLPGGHAAGDSGGVAGAGQLLLGQSPAALRLDLAPLRTIDPQPGRLVMFPSTMWHGTTPIGAGERLSIAFDVAAIG
ncbi:putative 2OG-Fe(II) oxygenase [Sphingomonas donggukensis]|uniref:2OG-Fe(II) oxygenase n=1 Tax=Sphingomonas donggukensis TaxID=2949093 RepID=A0ABY4TX14_9SPHN|nr:putative 2OG-Fe(II) oxygenase [Sphingomonas donggukensis]URW76931.1 putative 2OG-Fe(II) oxygenase [Sphingomonas donggukensis]